MNNCEVDDILDECQTQERAAYKLDLVDRVNRNDIKGAVSAVTAACERGLISGWEAGLDQEVIWTKHQNYVFALRN